MDKQDEMEALLRDLDAYRSQNKSKKQSRREILMVHTNFLKEER